MSTDFSKPPLAPKPSLDQSVLLTTCNQSSLGHRQSLHLYSNSMSRGPKPPLAPKPLLLNSEGRSSVYINNTLNICANGERICYEAHLTSQECADVEHQCKCLELCTDNSVLDSPDVDDTQKENADGSDEVLQSTVIMKGQDHDCSSVGEPVDPILDELMAIEAYCSSDNMCEVFSSKVDSEDTSSANDEVTDFDNNEQESREDLSVSTVQSPYNHIEKFSEQNTDEDLEGKDDMSIFHQHIGVNKYVLDLDCEGRELELDCLHQSAEESSSEERQLGECSTENDDIVLLASLDEETSLTHYESNEEAVSRTSVEEETEHYVTESTSINDAHDKADMCCLESLSSSVACLSEEEADGELEMTEDISNLAEDLSDEPQKLTEIDDEEFPPEKEIVEAINSEIDRNMEQEDNVDDGYETIEIKSEEESSEAAQDEGEVSKEDSAEKDDTLDDSCQIIPFESDCNEDLVDIPHGYLDEFLHIERGYLHQESSVHATRVNPNCIRNHNRVSECILEEESEDREEESGGQQFAYGISSLKEDELGHQSNEEGSENSDDKVTVPEKMLSKELGQSELGANCKCIDYSADCLSLTDDEEENPYVLENSLLSRSVNCFCRERIGISRSADSTLSQKSLRDDPSLEIDNNLLSIDLKNIVTRSRSLSGKITGCVPETVPEETTPESEFQYTTSEPLEAVNSNHLQHLEGKHTDINRLLPAKPRRFIQYPRSYSVEGRESPISMYSESNGTSFHNSTIRGKDDNISLPCVLTSSGSFSHRSQIYSSGVSTSSSGVDIPPPFELASITKKPITKSSPSLLIENDSPDKYFKKKKSSFKRFLTLKFRKKTENKIHVDVNVSSSRSSSESSYHGPSRLVDMDRRSLGGSPQLKPHSGKLCACDSPSAVVLYKDGKRKGTPKSFSRSVARVESFEDRTRPPFIPLPLTKPRSISFPNADTSDYENIPAMSSDYENVQIPPRRPTRAGTFTEFFEDPSRALASANENDGYVDMSSFTTFEMKQQAPDREAESRPSHPRCHERCPPLTYRIRRNATLRVPVTV